MTVRLIMRNCGCNQSYENTIQSFFELCIFKSFCIWYPILLLRLLMSKLKEVGCNMYWRHLISSKLLHGFLASWSSSSFKNYKTAAYWMLAFVESHNKIFRTKPKTWTVNFLSMPVYSFVFKDTAMKIRHLSFNTYHDLCAIKLVGEIT